MDTPGGDVYASVIIYEKIKEVQQKGIPVVTLMRGTAASGGYYIAAPSNKIIAHQETITGSIGVRLDVQSVEGLYEKLGFETRTMTNSGGSYKTGEGLFDDDPNGEEDKIYQKIIDETFDRFVMVVAEGRGMEKNEVLKFADGRVFTGLQAKEVGLVDEIGGFDKAMSVAAELAGVDDPTVIRYTQKDFWSSLMGYVSVLINPTAQIAKYVDATPGVRLRYMSTPE
jgi:protease-4